MTTNPSQTNFPFCSYYQAYVKKKYAWFVVGGLKGFEHVAFARTIDVKNSIFEFFVSPDLEDVFLEVMKSFEKQVLVFDLKKLENRLIKEDVL